MGLQNLSNETIGVIGAGSFGTVIGNLLSENRKVLLYARRPKVAEELQRNRVYKGMSIKDGVMMTNSLEELAHTCELIFPIVPSENFREMIRQLAPFLNPAHKLIHGTKGLDVKIPEGETLSTIQSLSRDQVKTMSEVITEESVVMRVGAVAGPNLAGEIAEGHPAATVVASHFDEVTREVQTALRSSMFRVHGNHDLFGIELAGVLKNIMAIASGILHGLEYGDNTKALLITRGLAEMVHIGKALGANPKAFLGLAGIGDLVATCNSPRSRNFTVGYRLAKGEKLNEILEDMEEVAEGIKTVSVVKAMANYYKFTAPITLTLYKSLFEEMDVRHGMRLLMEFPFTEDVEFL